MGRAHELGPTTGAEAFSTRAMDFGPLRKAPTAATTSLVKAWLPRPSCELQHRGGVADEGCLIHPLHLGDKRKRARMSEASSKRNGVKPSIDTGPKAAMSRPGQAPRSPKAAKGSMIAFKRSAVSPPTA